MPTEAELVRDRVAAALALWYGNEQNTAFIYLDDLTYHQHAAQSILRLLAAMANLSGVKAEATPELAEGRPASPEGGEASSLLPESLVDPLSV